MWYVYFLQSQKNLNYFYKGSTNNLERRLSQHNIGKVQSTVPYRPLKIVYYEGYLNEKAARLRESAIKTSGSVLTPLLKRIRESLKD